MALAPKFAGLKLVTTIGTTSSQPAQPHIIELYLDYVCPFSKKLFTKVYTEIVPILKCKYAGQVEIIFRQQIQPWHPSSTLVHESALAILRLWPEKFYVYSARLFASQRDFFDENVVDETRNDTYRRLATIAGAIGVNEDEFLDLLMIKRPGLNQGNAVTGDLKLVVKAARLVGIHVSPTVVFNGIVENAISSSWTTEQWEEWLENNIV